VLKTGPFGWVGQPTCVQRLDIAVKLGTPPTSPLLRMYAARRDTSPASGSERKLAMTNRPSGKASTGPRSTGRLRWPSNDGSAANPATGMAMPAATRPPIPIVAQARKLFLG
jgi:hypothetical protein